MEFDGIDISAQVSDALAQELTGSMFTALDSDPVLAAFTPADIPDDFPADAQPVDSDVIAADEAAPDSETLAGGDVFVEGLSGLVAVLFL